MTPTLAELENSTEFIARHIGIGEADEALMLKTVGAASRRELIDGIVPRSIARRSAMAIPAAISEAAALAELKAMASMNQVFRIAATSARKLHVVSSWKLDNSNT